MRQRRTQDLVKIEYFFVDIFSILGDGMVGDGMEGDGYGKRKRMSSITYPIYTIE